MKAVLSEVQDALKSAATCIVDSALVVARCKPTCEVCKCAVSLCLGAVNLFCAACDAH